MAEEPEDPQPAGFKTPAVFSNRFIVRVDSDGLTRIVFGDALVRNHMAERSAVILTVDNALQLAELLMNTITEARKKAPGQ